MKSAIGNWALLLTLLVALSACQRGNEEAETDEKEPATTEVGWTPIVGQIGRASCRERV